MTAESVPKWYSPESVIWLGQGNHKDVFRRLVTNGATHIIREVRTRRPGGHPDPNYQYPAEVLWHLSELADGEFALLNTHSIAVPPVDWHVTSRMGTARLVAHVAVVEGTEFVHQYGTPTYIAKEKASQAYSKSREPGHRLLEAHLGQCVNGFIRTEPNGPVQPYMVDIEPVFR